MSSTPNLEDQVSGSMDGPTSEDRVHGSLGNLKPPLAKLSKAPPSTAVFNTSTLGAFTPLSKDLGTEQNTALSYLLTYVTQGVAQTLKKEIDDSVRKQFNETLAAQTPVKTSAPVPGTSDSDNESPGSVAEIPESKRVRSRSEPEGFKFMSVLKPQQKENPFIINKGARPESIYSDVPERS